MPKKQVKILHLRGRNGMSMGALDCIAAANCRKNIVALENYSLAILTCKK